MGKLLLEKVLCMHEKRTRSGPLIIFLVGATESGVPVAGCDDIRITSGSEKPSEEKGNKNK